MAKDGAGRAEPTAVWFRECSVQAARMRQHQNNAKPNSAGKSIGSAGRGERKVQRGKLVVGAKGARVGHIGAAARWQAQGMAGREGGERETS